MKLANFIVDNIDTILSHWEAFARSLPPGRSMTVQALRNDAERMLRFVAADMGTSQSRDEQTAKGRGHGPVLPFGEQSAAHEHGVQRAAEGFSLIEMVSEYRALRASVTRLWQDAAVAQGDPSGASGALLELTRFHEAIDQILAESVARFSAKLEYDRDMFLAILGHDLRNPLQAIALSADAMTRARALSPSEQAELGRRIATSSARAQRLVQDLTEFARGRLGPSPALSMQQCNIQHVVQEAIDELRRAYPDRVFDYATSGDGLAQWDAARIQQMASNVIANAAQYGRPGTLFWCRCKPKTITYPCRCAVSASLSPRINAPHYSTRCDVARLRPSPTSVI